MGDPAPIGDDPIVGEPSGGSVKGPSYEQVSNGDTGHAESVEVVYDPAKVDYPKLLDVYWHNIDPTTTASQFCDSGDQYRTELGWRAVAHPDHGARSNRCRCRHRTWRGMRSHGRRRRSLRGYPAPC